MESNIVVLAVALLCAVAIAISHRFAARDPREPPIVHSKIPILGHIVGFIRYGQPYLIHLRYATLCRTTQLQF